MKLLVMSLILATGMQATADSMLFCQTMLGEQNKGLCYQKAALLANQDVIRSCSLFKDEYIQKNCLDAVVVNPTAITSNMVQECFWYSTHSNSFNDLYANKCLENLKNQKGDLP